MVLEEDLLKLPNLSRSFNFLEGRVYPTHLFITISAALNSGAEAAAGKAKLENAKHLLLVLNKAGCLRAVSLKGVFHVKSLGRTQLGNFPKQVPSPGVKIWDLPWLV